MPENRCVDFEDLRETLVEALHISSYSDLANQLQSYDLNMDFPGDFPGECAISFRTFFIGT